MRWIIPSLSAFFVLVWTHHRFFGYAEVGIVEWASVVALALAIVLTLIWGLTRFVVWAVKDRSKAPKPRAKVGF